MPTIEERARALFRDLPPLPPEAEAPAEPEAEPVAEPPARPERVTPPPAQAPAASGPSVVHRAPFIPPRISRPAPGADQSRGFRGPRPVFSSSPGAQGQIGRASCRERGWVGGAVGRL